MLKEINSRNVVLRSKIFKKTWLEDILLYICTTEF